jgi:ADP-dependent NAD(P)H-hydrate dehydratase / NAD(P)H-hydrate epimerase
MNRLVTAQEMARIDSQAQSRYGIPDTILMENAGQLAWRTLEKRLGRGRSRRIVFLAGPGNNGGDALVMARACATDGFHSPRVLLSKEPDKGLAELHANICRKLGLPTETWGPAAAGWLEESDCIVDGLLGTGITGPGRAPLGKIAAQVAKASENALVAAVDVPSGLWDGYRPGQPIVTAGLTLTLGLPKRSLYLPAARRHAGEIVPLDIGFPRELIRDPAIPGRLLDEASIAALVPPLASEDYKHRRGVVALFAGAPGTLGAGILSATAAGRSGAGLVRLYVDPELYAGASGACRSIMVGRTDPGTPPSLASFDAYVAGPGWSDDPLRIPLLESCIHSGLPGVLDAGALALLPRGFRSEEANTVLTPHPGEFTRLTKVSREELLADPLPAMMDLASDRRSVVVLKSHVSYVVGPDGRYAVYDGVNGALGTGGTGDLLAGIIGAFLARGVEAFEAASAAVALHGLVGRRVYGKRGWFLAEDMLEELSCALGDLVGMADYSHFDER